MLGAGSFLFDAGQLKARCRIGSLRKGKPQEGPPQRASTRT